MSVIVRMAMPLNCEHCPMSHWNKLNELTGCDAVGGKRYVSGDDEFWRVPRPSWCPIIGELPETHGDLIDRELLFKDIVELIITRKGTLSEVIEKQKAVIAVERKDDE